jgi:hypothetical protein
MGAGSSSKTLFVPIYMVTHHDGDDDDEVSNEVMEYHVFDF